MITHAAARSRRKRDASFPIEALGGNTRLFLPVGPAPQASNRPGGMTPSCSPVTHSPLAVSPGRASRPAVSLIPLTAGTL